jgi:hypothetical protein
MSLVPTSDLRIPNSERVESGGFTGLIGWPYRNWRL